ncbi:MAG: SAM-dependent methyltransferase [Actinomadura sp.]
MPRPDDGIAEPFPTSRVNPSCRIVYVDSDPLVLVHAHALLTSTPEGACHYVQADVRDPDGIVEQAARTLDFEQPIALMLMGILGFVGDYDEARSIIRRLLDAVPSGNFLALNDGTDPVYVAATDGYNQSGAVPYILRSREQIAGYFDGLRLVEPGVVTLSRWRPEATRLGEPEEVAVAGAVARKP